MNICPNCGANIEGLTHHCDCCGTPLITISSSFVWHTFVTEASGDLYVFMKEIFQKFDGIDFSYSNILQCIEVNVFCYPEPVIIEQGIKNRLYLSTTRKKAILTIVLNFDEYVCGSRYEKKELLRMKLKAGFERIRERASKYDFKIDQFLFEIIQSI